jgi:hypothetical protein
MWWECQRAGGVAYIETTDPASVVFESVQQHVSYDPATALLFETDGGFIFVPDFEGFDHVYTTLGQRPGMSAVDTDVL